MTAAVYHFDFSRSELPPRHGGGGTAPPLPGNFLPPRRWGLFSFISGLFGSAPDRPPEPEQSRPAVSPLPHSQPRDGGAPARPVRRIREAPPLPMLADYAPKPVADLEAMRAKLRALPRRRVEVIAAAIGSHPIDLMCFAMGAAA